VVRFLAATRFIGFFLAFALTLDFTAALAMSIPSLFLYSLSIVRISSNMTTLNNFIEIVDSAQRVWRAFSGFSNARVAASPHFHLESQAVATRNAFRNFMQRVLLAPR
jgi:hypothetical protein